MQCIICEAENFKEVSPKVRDSDEYKVVKCQNCGLLQLFPMPSDEEEKEFYNQNLQSKNIGEPEDLESIKENSWPDTIRRVKMVSGYLPRSSSILDIGSGYGFFLKEMEKRGYDVTGIEVSRERREISAKITGAKVLDINLFENDRSLANYDCITLFHVLEHIKNPIEFLKIIKKHLNNRGKLIVEVPNSADMLLEASQEYRDFYWQRAHLLYFDKESLKKVAQRAGFSTLDISYVQRYSIENFMNWFTSGRPQIERPSFQTKSKYKWLEDYYKKYLCQIGKSDTLILKSQR